MSEPKLKPCPFCGETPIFKAKSNICISTSTKAVEFNVYCQRCGFDFPGKYRMEIYFDLSSDKGVKIVCDERQEAADEWNRRVNENE